MSLSPAAPSWGDTDAVVSIHSRTSSHAKHNDTDTEADTTQQQQQQQQQHRPADRTERKEEQQEEQDTQQEEEEEQSLPEEDDEDTTSQASQQTSSTRAQTRPTGSPAAATPQRSKIRVAQRVVNSGPSSGYGSSYTPQRVVQPPSAATVAAAKRLHRSPYSALHPPVRSAASASAARGLPSLSSLWLLPTRVSVAERTTTAQQAKLTQKSYKADPSWKGEIPPNQTQMFDLRLSHPTILSGPLGQGPAPPLPLPGAKNTFEGTRGAPRSSSIKRQENGAASPALAPVVEETRVPTRRPKLSTAQRLALEAERENEALWAQSSAEEKEQLLAEQRRTVLDLRAKTRSARKVREEAWRAQEIPLRRAENAMLRGPEARLSQYELWWSREDAAKERWMRDNPGQALPDDFGRAATSAGDTQPLPIEEQFSAAKLNEDDDNISEPVDARGRSRGRSRSRSRSPSKRRGRSAAAPPFGSVTSGRPVDSAAWLGTGTVGVQFHLVDAEDPEANAPLWPEFPELAMQPQLQQQLQQQQAVQQAFEQQQQAHSSTSQVRQADNTPLASSAAAASVAAASAPVPSHRFTASSSDIQSVSAPTAAAAASAPAVEDDSGSFSFADMDDEDESLFPEETAQQPPPQHSQQQQHSAVTPETKQELAHNQQSAQIALQQPSASHTPPHAQSAHLRQASASASASHSKQASLDAFDRQSLAAPSASDASVATVVTPSNSGHLRNSSAMSQQNGAQHGRNGSSYGGGSEIAIAAAADASSPPHAAVAASRADGFASGGFSAPADETEPSRHSTSHSNGGSVAVVGLNSNAPAFIAESEHPDDATEFPDEDASRLHNHSEEPFTAGTTHTGTPREASRRVSGPVPSSMHARNQSFEEDKPSSVPATAAATQQTRSQHEALPQQQQSKPSSPVATQQAAPAPLDVSSPIATRTPAAATSVAPVAAAAAATTPSMSPVAIASPTAAASAPAPVSAVPGTPSEWKADESRLASGVEATKLPRKTGLFAPKAKQVNLILSRNSLGDSWLLHWGSKSKSKEEQQLNLSKSLKAFTRGADKGAFKANKDWNKKYADQSSQCFSLTFYDRVLDLVITSAFDAERFARVLTRIAHPSGEHRSPRATQGLH